MSFKEIIGIRTHQWTNQEDNLYNKLLQYFSKEQIFIVVDETNQSVNLPTHLQKLSLNLAFIENNQLLNFIHYNKSVGWLCGDYFYYVMKQYVQSDFYWLIEPDVDFTFDSISTFFEAFQESNVDGWVCNFKQIDERSDWFKSSLLIHNEAFNCLFPLNRLSTQAVDACKLERQRLSKLFRDSHSLSSKENKMGIHFPNDESIVANVLLRENLSIRDFRDVFPSAFEYMSYSDWWIRSQDELMMPKNQVVHPVRSINLAAQRITGKIIEFLNGTAHLDNVLVSEDSIKSLSNLISSNLSEYIAQRFSKNTRKQYLVTLVKEILSNVMSNQSSENTRVWIWNNDTVVIDHINQDSTYTLDFKLFDSGEVECCSFERSGKTLVAFLEHMKKAHPEISIINRKAYIFKIHTRNKEVINNNIYEAILLYSKVINDLHSD